MKWTGPHSPAATLHGVRAPGHVESVVRSAGRPIDNAARAAMEPRFGERFGDARLHTDEAAARSASAVSAGACALGRPAAPGAGRTPGRKPGPAPGTAGAPAAGGGGAGGRLSLPSTTNRFDLGSAAFTVALPSSLAVQLPMPFGAVAKLKPEIGRVSALCREVQVASFDFGVQGPLSAPETGAGADSPPPASLIGGSLRRHF